MPTNLGHWPNHARDTRVYGCSRTPTALLTFGTAPDNTISHRVKHPEVKTCTSPEHKK